MNKSDIVDQMASRTGITKRKATIALEAFIDGVSAALKSGEKITIVGFGTFTVKKRAARKGRNPATGASIKVKAKKVVKFRAGYELAAKLK